MLTHTEEVSNPLSEVTILQGLDSRIKCTIIAQYAVSFIPSLQESTSRLRARSSDARACFSSSRLLATKSRRSDKFAIGLSSC